MCDDLLDFDKIEFQRIEEKKIICENILKV